MPLTDSGLYYDITDLRPPWQAELPPIVMHHGIGTTGDMWSGWLPLLAVRHRVLRFDLRGFGRSRAAWRAGSTMDDLIADLLQVVSLSGAPEVHLVGESLGGTVALAAASAHAGRVRSVTVANATHRGTGVGRVRGWRQQIAEGGIAAWAQDMLAARFTDHAPLSAAARDWYARTQQACDAEPVIALGELLAGLDLSDTMRMLARPLLILSPDGSPFIGPGMASELKSVVPDAELMVFPATRHGLPFSHARACAEATLEFLQRRFG